MKTAKRGEARGTASRDLGGRRAQQARREKKSLQEACRRRGKAQLDQLGSSMATGGRKEERQEKRSDEEKERKIRDDKDTQGLNYGTCSKWIDTRSGKGAGPTQRVDDR